MVDIDKLVLFRHGSLGTEDHLFHYVGIYSLTAYYGMSCATVDGAAYAFGGHYPVSNKIARWDPSAKKWNELYKTLPYTVSYAIPAQMVRNGVHELYLVGGVLVTPVGSKVWINTTVRIAFEDKEGPVSQEDWMMNQGLSNIEVLETNAIRSKGFVFPAEMAG